MIYSMLLLIIINGSKLIGRELYLKTLSSAVSLVLSLCKLQVRGSSADRGETGVSAVRTLEEPLQHALGYAADIKRAAIRAAPPPMINRVRAVWRLWKPSVPYILEGL